MKRTSSSVRLAEATSLEGLNCSHRVWETNGGASRNFVRCRVCSPFLGRGCTGGVCNTGFDPLSTSTHDKEVVLVFFAAVIVSHVTALSRNTHRSLTLYFNHPQCLFSLALSSLLISAQHSHLPPNRYLLPSCLSEAHQVLYRLYLPRSRKYHQP